MGKIAIAMIVLEILATEAKMKGLLGRFLCPGPPEWEKLPWS